MLVTSAEAAAAAFAAPSGADAIGFDTESKPTFTKGARSQGPHLVQLATDTMAFLFPVDRLPHRDELKAILESPVALKMGFGLKSDIIRLQAKFAIAARNVLDLAHAPRPAPRARRPAHRKDMLGAKAAMAQYFGRNLQKSRKASTSNGARPERTERQMRDAADDAHMALRIYRAAQEELQRRPQRRIDDGWRSCDRKTISDSF